MAAPRVRGCPPGDCVGRVGRRLAMVQCAQLFLAKVLFHPVWAGTVQSQALVVDLFEGGSTGADLRDHCHRRAVTRLSKTPGAAGSGRAKSAEPSQSVSGGAALFKTRSMPRGPVPLSGPVPQRVMIAEEPTASRLRGIAMVPSGIPSMRCPPALRGLAIL